jgi:hypothetical protein
LLALLVATGADDALKKPDMEGGFLASFKACVAKEDYEGAAKLMDFSRSADPVVVKRFVTGFHLFSESKRDHQVVHIPVGSEAVPHTETCVFTMDQNGAKIESMEVAITLEVSFQDSTQIYLPLVCKGGRLLMVRLLTTSV